MNNFFKVVSWGLSKGSKEAFRPAMNLSSGELSALEGSTLMMTATASTATVRILQNQFPEILKWTNLLNSPMRSNVTLIIPPPDILPSSPEVILAPFITDMVQNRRVYLVIVRGRCSLHYRYGAK